MRPPISSIRYPVSIDAGLGRLAQETDYAAHVEQLIKQVLFTAPGERINLPEFGCGLRQMLFAPSNDALATLTEVTVLQALETWLGELISVESVKVQSMREVLEVRIQYTIRARRDRRILNLEVSL